MTATIQQRSGASAWNQFCEWVTSTNNRLYVGEYTDKGRKDLLFRSRREAFAYVEKAVSEYKSKAVTFVL